MSEGENDNLERNLVRNFLSGLELSGLSQSDKMIRVTENVAKIPWGEGRNIEDVITKGIGTCTGKHLLLQLCYDQLGIKYIPVVCTFRWDDQSVDYPDSLKAVLKEGEWDHGHNFVQLDSGVDVDITWDPALKNYGFKTFPENWDGRTSFVGVNNIITRWDNAEIAVMKSRLIDSLDMKTRERRKRFLERFISWIDAIHKNK